MPYDVTIDTEHEIGIARLTGRVTGETIIDVINALYTADAWQPGYNAIWDGRDIDGLIVTMKEALDIVRQSRHLDAQAGEGCTAVVISRGMYFNFVRMIFVRVGNGVRKRRAFHSLDAAIAWILARDTRPHPKRQMGVKEAPTIIRD